MLEEAERVVSEVLRPLIEADGGAIELVSATDVEIVVRLYGACAGCPGAPYTTAQVVEPVLRRELGPDVRVRIERAASTAKP